LTGGALATVRSPRGIDRAAHIGVYLQLVANREEAPSLPWRAASLRGEAMLGYLAPEEVKGH